MKRKTILKKIFESRVLTITILFFVFLIVLMVIDAFKKKDGDWDALKTRDFMNGVSYYDQNIKKNAVNSNPQVRMKTVYTGDGREFFINFITNFIAKGGPEKMLEGFSYVINHDELDCRAKKYKLLSTTLYDEKDAVIYTMTHQKEEWKNIPAKSDLEELIGEICN